MAYIGIQPAEKFTSFATQEFSTSATTSYTLDHAVANENEIALFVNNVRQQPGSGKAYTASGTALTLSAATASTDTMYCIFLGRALQTVTPATNSITAAMVGNDLISGKDALTSAPDDTDELLISDAGTIKRIDVSLVGGKNTPAFHATASGSQTISNDTATKLEYGNEVFDTNSNYDTSNYRFLPTTAGKYYFKAVARTADTTDFSQLWMEIHKNGSVVSRTIVPHDDYSAVSASLIITMNGSSDYLEAFFRHNKGSNLSLENQTYSCYSEGFKIIE